MSWGGVWEHERTLPGGFRTSPFARAQLVKFLSSIAFWSGNGSKSEVSDIEAFIDAAHVLAVTEHAVIQIVGKHTGPGGRGRRAIPGSRKTIQLDNIIDTGLWPNAQVDKWYKVRENDGRHLGFRF
jgi:hypothetical protein